jgi:hypothetical protein
MDGTRLALRLAMCLLAMAPLGAPASRAESPQSGSRVGDAGPAASPRLVAERPLGAWTGEWTSLDREIRRGSAEVLIAPRPGADGLAAQFTFLEGAKAWPGSQGRLHLTRAR